MVIADQPVREPLKELKAMLSELDVLTLTCKEKIKVHVSKDKRVYLVVEKGEILYTVEVMHIRSVAQGLRKDRKWIMQELRDLGVNC